ncbi:glucan biosynthesis protein, partial [Escherichia coli]|uniref:glucan biosynthesis protein n=2 Tax=Pseudomonadota TaxID=1224 RepID=UPI0028DEE11E
GLAMANGVGEHLWRVLDNPASTQGSRFDDPGVRGFGLVQRERRFAAYEDLEALYHRRPSLWVEPRGDWGPGGVYLLEIATR